MARKSGRHDCFFCGKPDQPAGNGWEIELHLNTEVSSTDHGSYTEHRIKYKPAHVYVSRCPSCVAAHNAAERAMLVAGGLTVLACVASGAAIGGLLALVQSPRETGAGAGAGAVLGLLGGIVWGFYRGYMALLRHHEACGIRWKHHHHKHPEVRKWLAQGYHVAKEVKDEAE